MRPSASECLSHEWFQVGSQQTTFHCVFLYVFCMCPVHFLLWKVIHFPHLFKEENLQESIDDKLKDYLRITMQPNTRLFVI